MVKHEIPGRILFTFDGQSMTAVGPRNILEQITLLREKFGNDPKLWNVETNIDLKNKLDPSIKRFINKVKNINNLSYKHEELCHCRMVQTETVLQAIEQGCQNVQEVSRTTLAGTGCGTCKVDIESLLKNYSD